MIVTAANSLMGCGKGLDKIRITSFDRLFVIVTYFCGMAPLQPIPHSGYYVADLAGLGRSIVCAASRRFDLCL